MYEAYVAILVGTVSGAAAIAALHLSRNLSPLPYTAVHLGTILLMIALVTLGYDHIPVGGRYPDTGLSRVLYIVVSWLAFVSTMLIHRTLRGTPIRPTENLP